MTNIHMMAEEGDAYSQAVLGEGYRRGDDGLEENEQIALRWIEASARQKHPLGLYNLAVMMEGGRGIPADPAKADELYKASADGMRKLADSGDKRAQLCMGVMYRRGKGVEKDENQAAFYYRQSAEQGYPPAQLNLASMLLHGQGVSRNGPEAEQWYRKAAEQGLVEAQFGLALMYEQGSAISQDINEAAKWYERAAEQNYPPAMHRLGRIYASRDDLEKDGLKALRWFRKAADLDYAPAQCDLGTLYHQGQGIPRDLSEAEKWYRIAADAGYARAQFNMAALRLEMTEGGHADHETLSWLKKSAEQDFEPAKKQLAQLGASSADISTIKKDMQREEQREIQARRRERALQTEPPVLLGMSLDMDIDEACRLLNRYTSRAYKTKRELAGQRYVIPYDRNHALITAGADGRIIEFDLPAEVVDELFKTHDLQGPAFVQTFTESMNLQVLDADKRQTRQGVSWNYQGQGFVLQLFKNRRLILRRQH